VTRGDTEFPKLFNKSQNGYWQKQDSEEVKKLFARAISIGPEVSADADFSKRQFLNFPSPPK
jgi:hypothetical protein